MIKRPKRITSTVATTETQSGPLSYTLKRSSARRTLSICIDEKASVTVSVPFSVKDDEVRSFLSEKETWILKGVAAAQKNQARVQERLFLSGNRFLFLGQEYPLQIQNADVKRIRLDFISESWQVKVPQEWSAKERHTKIRAKLIQWYRAQAEEVLGGRIFHYARIMNVEPKKVAVRTQKRMWGCCDYNTKTIHLNWQIIMAPMAVVDYVVVHEMCHLFVPNHSQRFWKMVEKFMPEYDQHRRWLKDHYWSMILPDS